jgi:hypothetical protein
VPIWFFPNHCSSRAGSNPTGWDHGCAVVIAEDANAVGGAEPEGVKDACRVEVVGFEVDVFESIEFEGANERA